MSIDEMFDDLRGIILELIESFVPTETHRIHNIIYSKETKQLLKKKLLIWKKAGNSDEYKHVSALFKRSLVKSEEERIYKRLNSGSKNFFGFMKSKFKGNSDIPAIRYKSNENIIMSDEGKAEIFGDCFSEFFNIDKDILPATGNLISKFSSDVIFTPENIELLLYKLKGRNNTSPDSIPSIFLKRACTPLAIPLCIIFTESYRVGRIPKSWKEAIVMPLHKKGSRSDPLNYRPISLTSNICKIMEKLIRKHLVQYLSENNLLSEKQFGFLNQRSTISQLIAYQNKLVFNSLNGLDTHSVYIDFQRAFDTVPLNKLIHKLETFGISPKLRNWLHSFVTDRKF
ncbi:Protein CBG27393 [Caenorhabditis briggsae]|uniref:Protein CBG27393 n=1 Tax=Caenorhabditis briggsae TaxID=6238 RepID=B6IH09_CAEBR|nr:Protein CBG27393 [Caenorhabditis briggsae]CAR99189.1 Protein CBG27393 [Caenorhabditis briggsae]